jgi:hypothetical protein
VEVCLKEARQFIGIEAHVHIGSSVLCDFFGIDFSNPAVAIWPSVFQVLLKSSAFYRCFVDSKRSFDRGAQRLQPGGEIIMELNAQSMYVNPTALVSKLGIPVTDDVAASLLKVPLPASSMAVVATGTSGAAAAPLMPVAPGSTKLNVVEFLKVSPTNLKECIAQHYTMYVMGSEILSGEIVKTKEAGSQIINCPTWIGRSPVEISDGEEKHKFAPNKYPRTITFGDMVIAASPKIGEFVNAVKIRELCDAGGIFDPITRQPKPLVLGADAFLGMDMSQLQAMTDDDAPAGNPPQAQIQAAQSLPPQPLSISDVTDAGADEKEEMAAPKKKIMKKKPISS